MKILHYDNFGQIKADTDNIPNGTRFSITGKNGGETWAETARFTEKRKYTILDWEGDFNESSDPLSTTKFIVII